MLKTIKTIGMITVGAKVVHDKREGKKIAKINEAKRYNVKGYENNLDARTAMIKANRK